MPLGKHFIQALHLFHETKLGGESLILFTKDSLGPIRPKAN